MYRSSDNSSFDTAHPAHEYARRTCCGVCRIGAEAFVVRVEGGPRGGYRRQEMIPMAQYVFSVLANDSSAYSATDEEMAAIDVFNEQLQADGHWVFAAGLAAPETATV